MEISISSTRRIALDGRRINIHTVHGISKITDLGKRDLIARYATRKDGMTEMGNQHPKVISDMESKLTQRQNTC